LSNIWDNYVLGVSTIWDCYVLGVSTIWDYYVLGVSTIWDYYVLGVSTIWDYYVFRLCPPPPVTNGPSIYANMSLLVLTLKSSYFSIVALHI